MNLPNLSEKENEELEAIKNAILAAVPCEKIYLFGSFAYGTPRADSDFDVFVVLKNDGQRQLDALFTMNCAVGKIQTRAVDLLAQKKIDFERLKSTFSVEKTVSEKGVLLYG